MKGPHGMLRVINSNAIFCYKGPPITPLSSQHYRVEQIEREKASKEWFIKAALSQIQF